MYEEYLAMPFVTSTGGFSPKFKAGNATIDIAACEPFACRIMTASLHGARRPEAEHDVWGRQEERRPKAEHRTVGASHSR
jgi:hypothetical protein